VPELYGQDLVERISRRSEKGEEILPQVVVLNACYSAAAADKDLDSSEKVTLPLAVELVNLGIPVVVGMGGRVADQACRLFASRFYEALLEDGEVVRASAEGRRFGIRHASDPLNSVDWGMPILVLAEGVTDLPRWQDLAEAEVRWRARATDFVAAERFPVFCDRLAFWNKYSLLMTPTDVQERLQELEYTSRQFLLIPCVPSPKIGDSWGRLGRTRLLEEFAAQAARDGHLPCLIRLDEQQDPPKDLPSLVDLIGYWAADARERFNLRWEWTFANQLERLAPKQAPPDTFPDSLKRVYREFKEEPTNPFVVSAAVCADLLALVAAARSGRAEPDRVKLLLLFHDLHRFPPDVLTSLFTHLLSPHGLRSAAAAIRIVLLYCDADGYKLKVDAINSGVGKLRGSLLKVDEALGPFANPEDHLAYEHFMLHWRPHPVMVKRSSDRRDFLAAFATQVGGIPSQLKTVGSVLLNWHLTYPPGGPPLRKANDEDLAAFIAKEER
jgi:hypothetical protein